MADYQVVDREQLDADLTDVANHIRAKAEISTPLEWPDGYKAAVDSIPTGVELPELTNPGDASKLLAGYQLIDGDGAVVVGNIPTVDAATPGVTIQANGDVVAFVDQAAGYTPGGYKTYKQAQDVIPAQTITPGTEDQEIPAYRYLTGKQTIKGDPNLLPENIPEDVVLFGVQGERKMSGSTPAPEPESKDVDFYDYDGRRLYSYTLAEAQALTELPPLPSREGLVCQEWNWTLSEIKDWGRKADVGATYTTDDGRTKIHITLTDAIDLTVTLAYDQTADEGVEIDWGDGSDLETITGTGAVSKSHTYGGTGTYIISMRVVSGTMSFSTASIFNRVSHQSSIAHVSMADGCTKIDDPALRYSVAKTIVLSRSVTYGPNLRYSTVEAVIIPRTATNTTFAYNGFYPAYALRVISAPRTAWSNGTTNNSCTRESYAITRLVAPTKDDTINNYAFNGSFSLREVVFDDSLLANIGNGAFGGCRGLVSFVIPQLVTTIGSGAFQNCVSLKLLKFLPTTPPSVENANAFSGIATDCVVEVPAASLAAYQAATNYSGIAAQMVGV